MFFDDGLREDLELDMESLQLALEKRLQNRAARADSAVIITGGVLRRWVEEEFEALLGERILAHELATGRTAN